MYSISTDLNRIYINSQIDFKIAKQFNDLFELACSQPLFDNVELYIASPGGEVNACELICNTIQLSYKPVDVYIVDKIQGKKGYNGVASGASVIASFCRKKIIDKDATFLIHHSRSMLGIKHDVEDVYFWMERTGLDYDTVQNLLLTEPKLDAETALNLGFVDEILY